jgi:ABC-type multidrug transport system fused ATPase/permease subunit
MLDLLIAMVKFTIIPVAGGLWLSISGLSRKMDMFENVVSSLSLGLVFAVLVGCASFLVGFTYVNLIVTCLMLILLGLFMVRRGFRSSTPKLEGLERRYWLPILLALVHVAFFAFYWHAFPYFPTAKGLDVMAHAQETRDVIGSSATEPDQLGAHLLLAFLYSFIGGKLLTSLQMTTAIVDILSIPLAYCVFQRIFRWNGQSAAYACVAFSLIIPSGLLHYFDTGTYANIIGDFFIMLSLLGVLVLWEEMSASSVMTVAVVEGVALVSHVSAVIFGAVMLGCSIIVFKSYRSKLRNYILGNLGFVVLPVAVLVIAPHFLYGEIELVLAHIAVRGNPAIALQAYLDNYLAYAGLFGFGVVLIAFTSTITRVQRYLESFLPATWFMFLFLAIFIGPTEDSWRYVLLSFVPASALVGQLLWKIERGIHLLARRGIRRKWLRKAFVRFIMISIFVALIISGSFPRLLTETYSAENSIRQRQLMIYDSMAWLASNASSNARVVSVDLSEYRYLSGFFNLPQTEEYELFILHGHGNPYDPSSERFLHYDYVAVSVDYVGLPNYYACSAMKLVYLNSQVAIFRVVGDSCTTNSTSSDLAVLTQEMI